MDKEVLKEEIKAMLESKGKSELKEFAEDIAKVAYEVIKIVVKHSENKIDDVALSALDGVIVDFLDKIDGQEG